MCVCSCSKVREWCRYNDKTQPEKKTISQQLMMSRCVALQGTGNADFLRSWKSGSSFCYKIFQVSQKNKPTKIIIPSAKWQAGGGGSWVFRGCVLFSSSGVLWLILVQQQQQQHKWNKEKPKENATTTIKTTTMTTGDDFLRDIVQAKE